MIGRILVETNILITIASLLCIVSTTCNSSYSTRSKISSKVSIEQNDISVEEISDTTAILTTKFYLSTSYVVVSKSKTNSYQEFNSLFVPKSDLIRGPPFSLV